MRKQRKLTHPKSEMTRLKLLWRDSLSEAGQDYWREQFASPRTQEELRHELLAKLGINLLYDLQLRRFLRWLEDEDWRKREAEAVELDRVELEALGLDGQQLRDELLKRMKERALARGDFKLGVAAVNLDLKAERVAITQRQLELQVRKADALDRAVNESLQPGGLTPEVLHKIEREHLNLM
jgi:hypothetical protein